MRGERKERRDERGGPVDAGVRLKTQSKRGNKKHDQHRGLYGPGEARGKMKRKKAD